MRALGIPKELAVAAKMNGHRQIGLPNLTHHLKPNLHATGADELHGARAAGQRPAHEREGAGGMRDAFFLS
jgi:hypothetical protein